MQKEVKEMLHGDIRAIVTHGVTYQIGDRIGTRKITAIDVFSEHILFPMVERTDWQYELEAYDGLIATFRCCCATVTRGRSEIMALNLAGRIYHIGDMVGGRKIVTIYENTPPSINEKIHYVLRDVSFMPIRVIDEDMTSIEIWYDKFEPF